MYWKLNPGDGHPRRRVSPPVPAQLVGEPARQPEAYVRPPPPVVVDGGCGNTDQYVPILVEAAPQRPQIARERVRREVACHLDVPPPLEAPLPRNRVAQEEYRRLPVVCETVLAKEKVIVSSPNIPYDAPIPVRPLSERLIGTVNMAPSGGCQNLSSLTHSASRIPRLPRKPRLR